jgi:hypothetical protein
MSGYKTNSGNNLKRQWGIPAVQVRYHKDGTWFMPLERFPVALYDPNGYIVFQTEQEYQSSRYLEIGQRVNVPDGVSKAPGYVRAPQSSSQQV